MHYFKTIYLFLLLAVSVSLEAHSRIVPENLRCESLSNPLGVDVTTPTLSWTIQVTSGIRLMHQTAYQVLVSSSLQNLQANEADLWNSGKMMSNQMSQVNYAGKSLISSNKYWWKVKVWDAAGNVSAWSKPAHWTMGVLSTNDWKAQWITAQGADRKSVV